MKEEIRVFWEQIRPMLERRFDGKAELTIKEVTKNNGSVLTGVYANYVGNTVRPTVYLEEFAMRYMEGEKLHILVDEIYRCLTHRAPEFDLDSFVDWDKAKLRICMRLVNREKNGELLKDIPHVSFLDLELVFYYLIPEEAKLGSASILIHNNHCEAWGITTEELFSYARDNTKHLNGPRIISMAEMLTEIGGPEFIQDKALPMWIMTSKNKYFGAVGLYYSDIIREFAKDRGKSLYVLPSSVHEIILLEDNGDDDSEKLREMVKEVNSTQVAADEVLSDSVYRFDLDSNHLSMLECAA